MIDSVFSLLNCLIDQFIYLKLIIFNLVFYCMFNMGDLTKNAHSQVISILAEYLNNDELFIFDSLVFGKSYLQINKLYPIFKITGMLHVLTFSSSNIYVLWSVFNKIKSKINYQLFTFLLLTWINSFIFFVDKSSGIFRVILAANLKIILPRVFGIQYHSLSTNFIICLLLITSNFDCLIDLSFQFSFLAAFGILFFIKNRQPLYKKNVNKQSILLTESLNKTEKHSSILKKLYFQFMESYKLFIVVQLYLQPLLIYYFGFINLISWFSNLFFIIYIDFLIICFWFIQILLVVLIPFSLIQTKVAFLISLMIKPLIDCLIHALQLCSQISITQFSLRLSLSYVIIWWLILTLFFYLRRSL